MTSHLFAAIPPVEQIDPARIPTTADETLFPQTSRIRLQAPLTPEMELPNAESVSFELKKIQLSGSKLIAAEKIKQIYVDYIGKKITIKKLQELVQQITVLFRNSGYVLSQAILPPQEIDKGEVEVKVIEGYVDQISIEGDCNRFSRWALTNYGAHIAKERPLHIDTLERYALLANELPGVKVRTVLKASKDKQGAADLVFVVNREHMNANLLVDNRGTKILGPYRILANVQVNEFLPGGKTDIRVLVTPHFKEIRHHEIFHQMQLNSHGLTWEIEYASTRSEADLSEQGINNVQSLGHSTDINTSFEYPMIRTRKQNFKALLGFRATKSINKIQGITNFKDILRILQFGLVYDLADRFGATIISVNMDQGLDILGASNALPSRAGYTKTFNKVAGVFTRFQRLYGPFSALFSYSGQYSFDQLPSLEEFGVGGSIFGLAYDSSEITGDHGVAWKVDLQMLLPIKRNNVFIVPPTVFGYVDGGNVWNINRSQRGTPSSLVSIGGGFKMKATKYLDCSLTVGKPLTKKLNVGNDRTVRLFFSILASI